MILCLIGGRTPARVLDLIGIKPRRKSVKSAHHRRFVTLVSPGVETHGLSVRLTALRKTRFKRVSVSVAAGFNRSGSE